MASPSAPKVSVVIATYAPGDALSRVIDSLDAQTMPQDEFEVVFVDDGSPDDTYDRLLEIAARRPNHRVFRIENSGWPSRPRNVGIERARGEYVFFMDHDDSLYPDGLRRAYEYARENDADVLNPKDGKTNDVWWGMPSFVGGNVPNAKTDGGIDLLMEMQPHKLYRRRLLLDHDIRFPEGSRVLWEDWFINVDAYRHADTVSVLADTPVYLWHASTTNSTHTFSPDRVDYWDRLGDMVEHIATALDGDARTRMLAHHVQTRVIDRCAHLVARGDQVPLPTREMAVERAGTLLGRYASDEVLALIPKRQLALMHLILARRPDLMKAFHEADLAFTASVTVDSAEWHAATLRFTATAMWEPKAPDVPVLWQKWGRVRRVVDPDLARAVPRELLDHTGDAEDLVVTVAARNRTDHVTWSVPYTIDTPRYGHNEAGARCLIARGTGSIDLERAVHGRPLDTTLWDVWMRTTWLGMARKRPVVYRGNALPVIAGGRGGVAYANQKNGLSIDLAQRTRSIAIDAEPRSGPAGPVDRFAAPLRNVTVTGSTSLDAGIVAIPEGRVPNDLPTGERQELLEKLALEGELAARVVADADGVRLTGGAPLPPGRYRLYARRDGKWQRTRRSIEVREDRQLVFD